MIEKKFNHFCETSAMTGDNVRETFETLAKHLYITHKSKLDQYVRSGKLRVQKEQEELDNSVLRNQSMALQTPKLGAQKKKKKCC